eukprot:1700591-Prymnesium_polylepis.1
MATGGRHRNARAGIGRLDPPGTTGAFVTRRPTWERSNGRGAGALTWEDSPTSKCLLKLGLRMRALSARSSQVCVVIGRRTVESAKASRIGSIVRSPTHRRPNVAAIRQSLSGSIKP